MKLTKMITILTITILMTISLLHAGTAIKYPMSWNFTAGSVYGKMQIQPIGAVALAVVDIPDFSNAVTGTFRIISNDGYIIYEKSNLTKGNIHVITDFSVNFPVEGTVTIEVRLSGAAGSAGTLKTILYTMR